MVDQPDPQHVDHDGHGSGFEHGHSKHPLANSQTNVAHTLPESDVSR